jgi:hypothetical protein
MSNASVMHAGKPVMSSAAEFEKYSRNRRKDIQSGAEYLAQAQGGEVEDWSEEADRRTPPNGKMFQDNQLTSCGFTLVKAYDYKSRTGEHLYQSVRYEHPAGAKQFLMRRRGSAASGGSEWIGDAGLVKVPYRWPELIERPDETVFFTEGEKDADRLAEAGLLATTLAGQNWSPEAAKAFKGRDVVLLFDNDDAGRDHELDAVKALQGFATQIRVVRLPGLGRTEDVSDWLDGGHTIAELQEVVTATISTGIAATPCPWIDPTKVPLRTWLYKPHYVSEFVSMLVSTGGIGKSSLAIVESLAMVSGKPLLGIKPAAQLRVWYWNGEDPVDELYRRFAAAMKHHELSEDDIGGRLFINSGRNMPIVIATEHKGRIVVDDHVIQHVTATVIESQIDVIIVDPFVTCHRVSENDNAGIERLAKAWAHIGEAANCAVMLVHHTVKPRGDEMTVDHGRGASALLAAARSARVINTMSKSEAEKAKVPESDRRLYFRAENGKANLAPPAENANWFKLVSVDLNNAGPMLFGDAIGVVTAWEYPKVELPVTSDADIRRCQEAIKSDGPWRKDVRAAKWVGIPIARALGHDLTDSDVKQSIKKLIKQWIEQKLLLIVSGKDNNHEDREFVEVGYEPAVEATAGAEVEPAAT